MNYVVLFSVTYPRGARTQKRARTHTQEDSMHEWEEDLQKWKRSPHKGEESPHKWEEVAYPGFEAR